MRRESFAEVRRRLFALYAAGEYIDALELARAAAVQHPEAVDRTTYWIACLLARLGEVGPALEVLEGGHNRGLWWPPAALETDSDLEPLRDTERFRAIVGEGRRAHAAAATRPAAEPIVTTTPGRARAAMMVLHARGQVAEDVVDQWPVGTDLMLIAPRSTQAFDMRSDCWDNPAIGVADVRRAIERAKADGADATDLPLLVGGFSQGAALAVILTASRRLRGIHGCIAVAPSAGWVIEVIGQEPIAGLGLRCLLVVGTLDNRLDECRRLAERLRSAGADVRLDVIDGIGHDYPADFAERLPAAIDWALATER